MPEHPTTRAFLLLHGWQNHRPAGHWQHWLAQRLGEHGHDVGYPALPDPDDPDLGQWLAELDVQLAALRTSEVTVVCHSLACLLWLHAVARDAVAAPVERVLLVAPPAPEILERYPEVAAFARPEVTAGQVSAAATYTGVVGSDDDPYCPAGAAATYARPLGLPVSVVTGGAHLDLGAGYGSWPSMFEWCAGRSGAGAILPRVAGSDRPIAG